MLVDYSRVPNSRRGWNNRKRKGGGDKDVLGGKKIEKLAIGGGGGGGGFRLFRTRYNMIYNMIYVLQRSLFVSPKTFSTANSCSNLLISIRACLKFGWRKHKENWNYISKEK